MGGMHSSAHFALAVTLLAPLAPAQARARDEVVVRLHSNEIILRAVAAEGGSVAQPGLASGSIASTNPSCGVDAFAWHGESLASGGTLAPNAAANPATAIGANGAPASIAFVASVSGQSRNQGVFVSDGTSVTPIAIGCGGGGGSGVPGSGCGDGTPIGGTFSGFFGGTVFAPATNEAGDVLFLCDVDGGSSPRALFLFRAATQSIVKVAAVNDPSPLGGTFLLVGPGSLNDAGDVVFLASGGTSGVSDLFKWSNGTVTKVARVGDPAPGGGTFSFLGTESFGFVDGTMIPAGPVPDINDLGQIAFRGIVSGGTVTRGIVLDTPGQARQWLVTAGAATPAGGTYFDFQGANLNDAGQIAFFADFQPTPTTFSAGWFVGAPGDWRKALAFFDPIDAGQCFGLAFSRNPMSALDEEGDLLLWTLVQFAASDEERVVLSGADGTLTTVAREGDATPLGGTFGGLDAWPSQDTHGRSAFGCFTPGAPGGILNAHFVASECPDASAVARNGSGVNALCFGNALAPVLGTTWTATVDASTHPGATTTFVLGFASPLAGLLLPIGELLVDPGSTLHAESIAAPVGGIALHSAAVPNDIGLAGLAIFAQALIAGGGAELCNAIDLVLGF